MKAASRQRGGEVGDDPRVSRRQILGCRCRCDRRICDQGSSSIKSILAQVTFSVNGTKGTINHCRIITPLFAKDFGVTFLKALQKPHVIIEGALTFLISYRV